MMTKILAAPGLPLAAPLVLAQACPETNVQYRQVDWVDAAYRGIGVSENPPPEQRKRLGLARSNRP